MSKHASPYNQCLKVLQDLYKDHPTTPISTHISTALADYSNFWGLPDKEVLYALNKYRAELEYHQTDEKELEKIIEEGKNLDKLFKEEEEEDV